MAVGPLASQEVNADALSVYLASQGVNADLLSVYTEALKA